MTDATRPGSLWRNRDYLLLWSGQIVSTVGTGVSGIAMPLLILALTGSPAAAGVAGMLVTIPYVVFSLPAGALVDRWDRKRVMIICDAVRACAFASIPLAVFLNALTVWQLYAVALVEGTFFVFFNLAEVAALPRVVTTVQLPAATAQNLATQSVAGLVGPGLGGWLFESIARSAPFGADAVSYAVSVLSLLTIRTRFQGVKAAAPRNLRAEIKEGLIWAWRDPLIRFTAFLSGGTNFVFMGTSLLLIVLAQSLHADAAAIGTMFSAGAAGSVAGALVAQWVAGRFGVGQIVIVTTIADALLFPLYAVAPDVVTLAVLTSLLFLLAPIYSVAVLSYRLALTPDALQGRVNSAVRLVAFGFQPLGSLVAGVLLERAGTGPTIAVLAAVLIALALGALLNPDLRRAPAAPADAADAAP